jgi:hypothetical protein
LQTKAFMAEKVKYILLSKNKIAQWILKTFGRFNQTRNNTDKIYKK